MFTAPASAGRNPANLRTSSSLLPDTESLRTRLLHLTPCEPCRQLDLDMAKNLQDQRFCSVCNQARLFTKCGTNHLVHALVSLFLCGLWIPIWIIAGLSNACEPYRCTQCGQGTGALPKGLIAVALSGIVVWCVASYYAYESAMSSFRSPSVSEQVPPHSVADQRPPLPQEPAEDSAKIAAGQAAVEQAKAAAEQKKAETLTRMLKYHQDLAAKGDPYGQWQMGHRYAVGDGVEKNLAKARLLLGAAADQGQSDAAKELASLPPQ